MASCSSKSGPEEALYEFSMDPIFWATAKLFICDILELQSSTTLPDTFLLYNRTISRVCIMGYIVGVKKRENVSEFIVDDGTGVISCFDWDHLSYLKDQKEVLKQTTDTEGFNIGMLVKLHGKLSVFRNEKQITIEAIRKENDANAEIHHWLQIISLNQEDYQLCEKSPSHQGSGE
ncbi:CST complex subunit STN1-like [Rhopilema esculentum]|uniref:CST complex subunit STN1-like n=1 Tax=Rhopilema esculentum TaxID=499914 RepID=UPI0031DF2293